MLEWIISSCVLILVVALLRQLTLGKINSRLRYALWLPVLLRLLIPFSPVPSNISVAGAIPEPMTNRVESAVSEPLGYVGYELPDLALEEPDPSLPEAEQKLQAEKNLAKWEHAVERAKAETGRAVTMKNILLAAWIAGAATVALCLVISNLRFGARLRRSRTLLKTEGKRPVYVSKILETPCLFGLFRPAVYVTPEVAENETALRHVLAHECTHARHGDHLWAILRGMCLAVHWYNPLVWLAAALTRQDAELACDEGAILSLGEVERVSYGSTLIALSVGHGGLLLTATTMRGGKRSLKERIALIAKKPKNAAIAVTVVLIIAAVAVASTFTGEAETIDVKAQLRAVEWPKALPGTYSEGTQEIFEQIYDCFDMYNEARPEDNVGVSGMGVAGDYIEVDCYGSDMAEFEKLADFPKYIKLNYDPDAIDPTDTHPIPREPESRVSYNNGLTVTMDRSVYPLYPKTIGFTWTATTMDINYGEAWRLDKYIDGEWHIVPANHNFVSIGYTLQAGKTERRSYTPPRLGEGLYRLTVADYSVEFAVSAEEEYSSGKDDGVGMNANASIGRLRWGASRDEVIAIAEEMAVEQGFTVNVGERFVSLKDYPIFGRKADITLITTEFSPENYPTLEENTGSLLTGAEIFVKSSDRGYVVSEISAVLGEQETKRLGFYDYAGDVGYGFRNEITDVQSYYWHGRQNVIESLGLEKLKSIYPHKEEKELLKDFYNTYEYTVYAQEGETFLNLGDDMVFVMVDASATVIKDILSR